MSADILGIPEFFDTTGAPTEGDLQKGEWAKAVDTLEGLLSNSTDGYVSNKALRRSLEELGVPNAAELCIQLKLYDHDTGDNLQKCPSIRWHYKGRSFLTEDAFKAAEVQVDSAADAAGEAAAQAVDQNTITSDNCDEPPKRQYRQEEARLVTYVKDALNSIYESEFLPDDNFDVSYDVHSERAGSEFENIDVIAIHWRTESVAELVAVEVKLAFSASAVQQAINYTRFAHRVWLAVPVSSKVEEAAAELRENNPRLFEYVISRGIGILGCRRGRGSSYAVYPLHWPKLNALDEIEKAEFIERHRSTFEEAGVVAPPQERSYPKLR